MASLGHPNKFQRVSRLGSVTARHSSSGRQQNFAVLNRGRHLYSAGRPSRWALAHILVVLVLAWTCSIISVQYEGGVAAGRKTDAARTAEGGSFAAVVDRLRIRGSGRETRQQTVPTAAIAAAASRGQTSQVAGEGTC